MGIDRCDDVEQAGYNDKAFTVVGCRDLYGIRTKAKLAADQVKEAASEIACEAQHIQNVLGAGVKLALHGNSEYEHAADSKEQQRSANPFALHKVPCSGHEPASQ